MPRQRGWPTAGSEVIVITAVSVRKLTAEGCVRYPLQRPDNQSAGRDVLRHLGSRRFSRESRGWNGRRPRHRAGPCVLCRRVEPVRRRYRIRGAQRTLEPGGAAGPYRSVAGFDLPFSSPGTLSPVSSNGRSKEAPGSCAVRDRASLSRCPALLNSSSFRPVPAARVVVRRPIQSQLLNHGAQL